jgi:hypothetical protein
METFNEFYTASEAREKLGGITAEELKRYTDAGKIEKLIPSYNKKKGFYKKSDVDRLAREARVLTKPRDENNKTITGITDWARSHDLPYMLAYDYENYGPANTVDISITRTWFEKNPYMARILFNGNDRRDIWGGITIMPMNEETILRLLRDEIKEHQIIADDILIYEKGNKYYCYVASATVKEEHATHFRELLSSVFDFWCERYPEIQIEKLYAYAGSEKGWDLIKRLFFAPRHDLGRNAFELDPTLRNPSKLIKPFQECLISKGAKIETPI